MTINKKLRKPSLFFAALMLILVDNATNRQTVYGSLAQEDQIIKASQYAPFIKHLAPVYKVEPDLIFAIMKTESAFDPKAVSGAGALGLMQLMPKTAQGEYEQATNTSLDPEFFKRQLLDQPDLNILLAVRHLSTLEHAFRRVKNTKKRQALILASYNAGFKRVKHAFGCARLACVGLQTNDITWKTFAGNLKKLPRETRLYIKLVEQNRPLANSLL